MLIPLRGFGPYWAVLGPFWAILGSFWVILVIFDQNEYRSEKGVLDRFRAVFGPFSGRFRAVLGHFGAILARNGHFGLNIAICGLIMPA